MVSKYNVLWWVTMFDAWCNGRTANSIFANPYWETYPNDSTDEDQSKARFWVTGYLSKFTSGVKHEATA